MQLLAWARSAAGGRPVAWAVEGTRHYGLGLARHLTAQDEHVSEIGCSRHIGKRRAGKSDPIDAVRAARELLARPVPAQMGADGDREALRLLMTGRDNAVQSAKTARTALAAVLVTAPADLREQIRPLPRERRAKACAALTCPAGADRQTRVLHQALARLGQRIAAVAEVAANLEAQISEIAGDMTPGLVTAEYGLGYLSAAQILLSWSHAGRIRSEQRSRCSQAPHPSRCPPAGPTGTGSTGSATASSTAPSTPSPSPGCAATSPPRPTPSAAGPKAKPTAKSAAASSATSPATSTEPSPTAASAALGKHRSVIWRQHVHPRVPVQVTVLPRPRKSARVRVSCCTSVRTPLPVLQFPLAPCRSTRGALSS